MTTTSRKANPRAYLTLGDITEMLLNAGHLGGSADAHNTVRTWRKRGKLPDPDATARRLDIDPARLRRAPSQVGESPPEAPAGPATLETLLAEVRIVRKTQEEILSILKGEAAPRSDAEPRAASSAEAPASSSPGPLSSKA